MADVIDIRVDVDDNDVIGSLQLFEKYQRKVDQTKKQFDRLAKAHNTGKISAQQYSKGVNQTEREIEGLNKDMKQAIANQRQLNSTVSQGGNQIARYDNAAQKTAQTFKRRFNTGMQQAGFQVGDLAVQLQGGTNAAVAFGQQGSQLLGIWGPAGAIAGAGLAIATAFIAPLIDAQKEAEDLTKVIGKLDTAISDLKDASITGVEGLQALKEQYGDLDEQLVTLIQRQTEFNRVQATQAFRGLAEQVRGQARSSLEVIGQGQQLPGQLQGQQRLREFAEQFELALPEAEKLRGEINSLLNVSEDDFPDAVAEAARTVEELGGVSLEANPKLFELGISLQEAALKASEKAKADRDAKESQDFLSKGYKELNQILDSANAKTSASVEKDKEKAVSLRSLVDAQRGQLRQERVLIQLSGERKDAAKAAFALAKQLPDAFVEANRKEIVLAGEAIAAQKQLNKVILERKELVDNLASTIEDSFADSVTSVVDGTKSIKQAFSDMARSILKELWDILFVQNLLSKDSGGQSFVGSIISSGANALLGSVGNVAGSSTTGTPLGVSDITLPTFAKGGAFSNGSVVNSPTLFPMANGAGLMGEAGPEAVMPLKRGKDGKLGVQSSGGDQSVVIHQNFNFTANGDESVKRMIAEATPQIAKVTENQILQSRKRGGVFKQAFSGG